MIDESKLTIRPATLDDADFIATTIIEAEKSFSNKAGTANYFEISEKEYHRYLVEMLEEEVDGCEISLNSFVVAEYLGETVAARGGWLEGDNEDEMPSAILKSNLFAYILPKEVIKRGQLHADVVKELQIDREMGTYQLENSFTLEGFRGNHIMGKLDAYHLNIAKEKGAKKVQAHVYQCNEGSIKACERSGFRIVRRFTSNHPLVKLFYPDDTMILLECEL